MWSSKREKEKDSGEYENKAKQTSRPFIKKKEKKKGWKNFYNACYMRYNVFFPLSLSEDNICKHNMICQCA